MLVRVPDIDCGQKVGWSGRWQTEVRRRRRGGGEGAKTSFEVVPWRKLYPSV